MPPGLILRPFRALRYREASQERMAARTSPPYDVVDESGRCALEAADPHNVVQLILPRDAENGGSCYRHAAELLEAWQQDGVLAADAEPALYVYEIELGGHVQRGLLGAVGLAQPEDEIILPHENTMAGPVADRLALIEATGANLEPIFLVYDGGGAASAAVARADAVEPLLNFATPDGAHHRLWALTDSATLEQIAADLQPRRAVIADGHHRYATYLQYQRRRHEAGDGPGPWDFGLSFLVDAQAFGPQVHAIHRAVPSLPVAEAASRAAQGFAVREIPGGVDAAVGELAAAREKGTAFALTAAGPQAPAYLLTDPDGAALNEALPAGHSAAWNGLDVSIAHAFLIRALWDVADNEQTVLYQHDVEAAVRAAGSDGTALLLNPTPVEAVAAVAAAGDRMPRKSTLFTPKPRTGIALRLLSHG